MGERCTYLTPDLLATAPARLNAVIGGYDLATVDQK